VRDIFAGGKRLAYGARALTEGGYQSVPKLAFPGGALIGCDAGFMNVPRIKGSHNAMLSGMMAAEAAAAALSAGRSHDELAEYEAGWRTSDIGKDLRKVRNAKPLWSKFGTLAGIALGGLDMWTNTFGFSLFGTLAHGKPDYASLNPASECTPIAYPKPDGKLTFDRLSSVFLSNTNHEEDQPVHLRMANMSLQKSSEYDVFAGPSARYCPAGVYEWVEEGGAPKFVINAQNCVHCKTCDIKDPNQNITWVPPEGGGGPNPWEKVLHTGDLFQVDEEGFLYFVGRKDDIIKTRGEKVAPKEVEAVLHAHPKIAEAVVAGISDKILGQAIVAMVVASDPTLTEREVIRHCAQHLEDFMVPKTVEFRADLPKTDTGKISRRLAGEALKCEASQQKLF
jgi:ferredoxin-like protein FixX